MDLHLISTIHFVQFKGHSPNVELQKKKNKENKKKKKRFQKCIIEFENKEKQKQI